MTTAAKLFFSVLDDGLSVLILDWYMLGGAVPLRSLLRVKTRSARCSPRGFQFTMHPRHLMSVPWRRCTRRCACARWNLPEVSVHCAGVAPPRFLPDDASRYHPHREQGEHGPRIPWYGSERFDE